VAVALFAAAPVHAAQTLLPMSPIGKVWIKQVPFFQAISLSIRKEPFAAMDESNLKLSRFVAMQRFEQIRPLALEISGLEWEPGSPEPVAFFMPLPSTDRVLVPSDEAMNLMEYTSGKVASISFRGPYDYATVQPFLRQMQAWLKDTETITAGKPRILFYHHRAFRPDMFKCIEIQVPVR